MLLWIVYDESAYSREHREETIERNVTLLKVRDPRYKRKEKNDLPFDTKMKKTMLDSFEKTKGFKVARSFASWKQNVKRIDNWTTPGTLSVSLLSLSLKTFCSLHRNSLFYLSILRKSVKSIKFKSYYIMRVPPSRIPQQCPIFLIICVILFPLRKKFAIVVQQFGSAREERIRRNIENDFHHDPNTIYGRSKRGIVAKERLHSSQWKRFRLTPDLKRPSHWV